MHDTSLIFSLNNVLVIFGLKPGGFKVQFDMCKEGNGELESKHCDEKELAVAINNYGESNFRKHF